MWRHDTCQQKTNRTKLCIQNWGNKVDFDLIWGDFYYLCPNVLGVNQQVISKMERSEEI